MAAIVPVRHPPALTNVRVVCDGPAPGRPKPDQPPDPARTGALPGPGAATRAATDRGGYSTLLNQNSDKPADNRTSTAAASASRPETSVSFFSTVSRVLSDSYTCWRFSAVPA